MSQDLLADFKQAARRFASGVTVVTARRGNEVYGLTVSAFTSLSVDPLMVLVSVRSGSILTEMIRESGSFAVSILRQEQQVASQFFAVSGRSPAQEAFPEVECVTDATGAPIVADCLAYFDCTVDQAIPGGDHTIFIGAVQAATGRPGEPLVYFDGAYRGVRNLGEPVSAGSAS
jgi:flavin reductase (DIM6/NTAB) family NADH-FMN oxidoreductase RutF